MNTAASKRTREEREMRARGNEEGLASKIAWLGTDGRNEGIVGAQQRRSTTLALQSRPVRSTQEQERRFSWGLALPTPLVDVVVRDGRLQEPAPKAALERLPLEVLSKILQYAFEFCEVHVY